MIYRMTDRNTFRSSIINHRSSLSAALGFAALIFAGCAGSLQAGVDDTAEARVQAPLADVRTALSQVLTEQGYDVSESDGGLRTGYRGQSAGPWNGLLHSRFGVSRSQVQALLVDEGAGATRVTVLVRHEGKKWIWEPWRTGQPPLAESAVNQLRLLRNQLRLLNVQPASEPSSSSSPNLSAIR
jgi:hypothetical protein